MTNRINFPLRSPSTPSELKLCRDGFIRKLLKDMNYVEAVVPSAQAAKKKFQVESDKPLTAEGIAFGRLLGVLDEPSKIEEEKLAFIHKVQSKKSMIWTVESFNRMVKKTAIHIELSLLNKKIETMNLLWPGNVRFLPFNMFSWSLEFLVQRQQLKNFLFIDLLEREIGASDLDSIKFKIDLIELSEYVRAIEEDIADDIDMCAHVVPNLRECKIGLNLQDRWTKDMNNMISEHVEMVSTLFSRKHGIEGLELRRADLEDRFRLVDSYAPIEGRYVVNWHHTVAEQGSFKEDLQLDATRKKIATLKRLIDMDNFSHQCSLNMFFITIEKYKNRYDQMVEQYDTDLEEAENNVNYTRNRLNKAKDDFKFLQNNLIVMREKVEKVRALIEIEGEGRFASPNQDISQRKSKKSKKVKRKGRGK